VVVGREEKIKKFVSRDYWEVHGAFGAKAGEYAGRWFDESFQKPKDGEAVDLKAERIWNQEKAEQIRTKCLGQPGVVTEESKPTTQLSPLLFDLTSLQREGNSRFGLPAQRTLAIAQALYERYKVLTYPRTDSRALPEDYVATVKQTMEMLGRTEFGPFAQEVLRRDWVKPNKRIFNNAKVSDHFAIIPTSLEPKNLGDMEAKIYDMVVRRFLAIFYPAAEFLVTTRITRVREEPFKSEGKVLVNAGWLAVYGREAEQEDQTPTLARVEPNESVETKNVEVMANQTKPPARFTEATLLSAMEGAGKLVEDEELREAMREKGLGTPSTRAAVIEGLLHEKYLFRQGKELIPTAKAFSLITLLRGLEVPELFSPELTGDWEFKLRQMEQGQLRREEFMRQIADMTRHIVGQAKGHENDTIPGDYATLKAPCPKCGGVIKENYKKFQCEKCDFGFWKIVAGRQFEEAEAEELLKNHVVGPLQGFRSRLGKPFAGLIRMKDDFSMEFDFGQNGEKDAPVDFSGQEPLGTCPKCSSHVFESGMRYVCEKAVGPEKTCDFTTGKIILQQTIEREQVKKLLTTRKTDLLPKFISKKGRPFAAFLIIGEKGKVEFEFEKREKKAGKGRGAKKEPSPPVDFTGKEPLGKCPKCESPVFETETDYLCERSQATEKRCKFKTARTVLGQPISVEQIKKLLEHGKTDLLDKFVSKAGRNFSAWLVVDDSGKVTFEFPPRDELPSA
jgi:DNA topoisomerase-3